MRRILQLATIAGLAAAAADAAAAGVLSGQAAVVSDYRYRGESLTRGGPAAQLQATWAGAAGVYATGWVSTLREAPGPRFGADGLELSATAGRAWDVGRFRLDAAVTRYAYTNGGEGYFELPVTLSTSLGPARLSAGGAWAPAQRSTGSRASRYVYAAAAWEQASWPVQPRVSAGYEQGAFADHKLDWSVGIGMARGRFTLALDYVGATDGAGSALVAGLQRSF